jgi:hypothetical protein
VDDIYKCALSRTARIPRAIPSQMVYAEAEFYDLTFSYSKRGKHL